MKPTILFAAALVMAAVPVGPASASYSGDQVLCAGDGRPCINNAVYDGRGITITWSAGDAYDVFNVRWSRPGRDETQNEVHGLQFVVSPVHAGTVYHFAVQSCVTRTFRSSRCTAWDDQVVTTTPPDPFACVQGFVWREAFANDRVCVSPAWRQQARNDNLAAASRRSPAGGDYGPDTCLAGYVWREGNRYDHVCVTPQVRAQTARENALAATRRVH
jgi:hypothetical protein